MARGDEDLVLIEQLLNHDQSSLQTAPLTCNQMAKLLQSFLALAKECLGAYSLAHDLSSKSRLISDLILLRLFRATGRPPSNNLRKIQVKRGTSLQYRLNNGDLQGIREVWMDECYRPPHQLQPDVLIDLGGNIGLTTTWFNTQFSIQATSVVEPDPENADLIRRNLETNGIAAIVHRAAIGPKAGNVRFATASSSNLGYVDHSTLPPDSDSISVPMLTMDSILEDYCHNDQQTTILVKVDIEGGEAALFRENLSWLRQVDAIIAEFHPPTVDCDLIASEIEAHGFRHLPANSVFPGSMTFFYRADTIPLENERIVSQ